MKKSARMRYKAWHKENKHSLRSAAKLIGVSYFAVDGWLTGRSIPTYPNARRIELVTGIKAESWFQ